MSIRWKESEFEYCNDVMRCTEKKLKIEDIESIVVVMDSKTKEPLVKLMANIDFSVIRDLSLDSKRLTYLPEELGEQLKSLVHLDLSNNELKTLPQSLRCLTQLKCLILNGNKLIDMPLIVTKISSLEVLKIAQNNLQILPENLGDLKFLNTLDLSSNDLSNLPNSCETLDQLKELNLSYNRFEILPQCIINGTISLESLDVSGNPSISLRIPPASKKLKSLYARDLGLCKKFPAWLLRGEAPDLQLLDCDGTNFKHADFLDNHKSLKLKTLSLENCGIFDNFVKNITRQTDELKTLRIGSCDNKIKPNYFWELPIKNLQRPSLLTELIMRGTALPNVCREIGKFVNLVKLDLSRNKIYSLPNEICRLVKLQVLLIDKNIITSLPDDIGNMISLKELKANGNHLGNLPKSVIELQQLLYIDLYENDFQQFPEELNSLKSLIGVDIDQNYFTTDDLRIREAPYDALKCSLRDRYQVPEHTMRNDGRKHESEDDEFSDSKSDISSISCDEPITTYKENENVTNNEESWDLSDDSTDNFDPTCWPRESSNVRRDSYVSCISFRKNNFCPADMHNISVKRKIALMRQRGEIKDDFEIVEGQFDDA